MLNIAQNTFKEIIRNKFLYVIVFFAIVFIAFSLALWKLTLGEDEKIIVDFGLSMIEVFGLIWVLFIWSQLLFKEIEGKTIFLILSKPIKRSEFILWKFAGFSFAIAIITLIQSLVFLAMLLLKGIPVDSLILYALLFTFFKFEISLAIVFFLSTFMSTILTILVSVMIYICAHSFTLLLDLVSRLQNKVATLWVQLLQLLFPPFEALNIKDVIGMYKDFPPFYFPLNAFYSIVYLCIILFFTVLIFNKKTFER